MIELDKVWMLKRKLFENVKMIGIVKVFLFLLIGMIGGGVGKEICPKMCTCDVFEGYRRADCSDQNLASPYTNVAKSVEILNLSGNEITSIDNECLKDYKDLIKLSFARNSLHNIELFAFESLEKLNYLDLSDNRLEVVDNRILEMNKKLTFLDMSKNKFMLVDDKPLIMSETLEFLSLRNSHLSHVYDSFFTELPNLIDLDISNNLLITLVPSAFEPLDSLQFINLEYNRFTCDFRIETTLQMFKQRKVHVKIDKCVKNSKKPMFEKMILHPDMTTEIPDREDVEIDLVWGSSTGGFNHTEFDDENESKAETFSGYYMKIKAEDDVDGDFNCDEDEMFPSTCECHQKFIKLYESTEKFHTIQTRRMEIRVATVFFVGSILGIIAGGVIFFVLSLIRKKCENANKKQVERQKARDRLILTTVRMAHASPQGSPMPAMRNRFTVPSGREPVMTAERPQPELIIPARSPMPTPRSVHNRVSESPVNARRAIESSPRPRNVSQIQNNNRTRVEYSPTAQLLHKLFRNRDPSLLPHPSEVTPLTPGNSRSSSARPSSHRLHEETIYSEIPCAPAPTEPDIDASSEYLSIDNISLTLNLDNVRTECVTPPPPYRSIFDDDK